MWENPLLILGILVFHLIMYLSVLQESKNMQWTWWLLKAI